MIYWRRIEECATWVRPTESGGKPGSVGIFVFWGRSGANLVVISLSGVMFIVAAILFVLAAIPPTEPHRGRLMSVGLAFVAGGHLVA